VLDGAREDGESGEGGDGGVHGRKVWMVGERMWRFDWLIEESLIATALKIGCRAIALAVAGGAWQQLKKAGDFDRVGSSF